MPALYSARGMDLLLCDPGSSSESRLPGTGVRIKPRGRILSPLPPWAAPPTGQSVSRPVLPLPTLCCFPLPSSSPLCWPRKANLAFRLPGPERMSAHWLVFRNVCVNALYGMFATQQDQHKGLVPTHFKGRIAPFLGGKCV